MTNIELQWQPLQTMESQTALIWSLSSDLMVRKTRTGPGFFARS